MPKRLEMTNEIAGRIRQSAGAEIDVSKLAVFETIAANTRPLNKRGSIFNGGVINADMLAEMAKVPLLSGGIPLHTMHQQGSELPVGKTFYADVVPDGSGQPELRSQFYVLSSEAQLVERLDTGIIDEVSVGVRSKQILCSACGFDYMSPKASIINFYEQKCENDHIIGESGVHVELKGLDRWMELSLVSAGAADKPKIVGRTQALLGAEQYTALAASGIAPDATTLFATVKDDPMDTNLTTLIADNSDKAAKLAVADMKLTAATADVTRLTGEVATLSAANATLATEVKTLKETTGADVATLKAEVAEVTEFLTGQLKAANTAAGITFKDDELPKDIKGLRAALDAATVSVHKLIPVGGKSNATDKKTDEQRKVDLSAFKTRS